MDSKSNILYDSMTEEKKDEEYISPHERRIQKHQEKKEEVLKELANKKPKGKRKGNKFLMYLIVILVAATIFQFVLAPKPQQTSNQNQSTSTTPLTGWESLSRPTIGDSWTAEYSIYLCGEKQQPQPKSENIGIYTEGDEKIYIKPTKQEQTGQNANLGRFFQSLGKKFSETELLDKKNGDMCSSTNQTGKVKLLVNGQENKEFKNYVPRDGDNVEFKFE